MNLIEEISRRHDPATLAVVSGERRVTYGDLFRHAQEIAAQIPRIGRIPRIGLQCPNGVSYIVLSMGVLLAGGCLVPLAEELTAAERSEIATTTALDFTVFAAGDAATELPPALVFLTGGGYTENQVSIADQRVLLDTIPILFVYASNEAGWSEGIQSQNAPSTWSFLRYSPGGHGTRMFEVQPGSMDAVTTWIAERL